MESLLNVKDLNVYYGSIHAVKHIDFHVNQGEIVTLIGSNGAGKSSTLNTIAGLITTCTGEMIFDGYDLSKIPAYKTAEKGLSLVPEGRRVFLQMSVEENLQMGAYCKHKSTIPGNLEMVYELFPRLKERRTQISGTLSGGEQQMLAMGRALMCNPKMIMLDEPSMGLAPILVQQIFSIIKDLKKTGVTVLLVEQNAAAALAVADRAYVLETGRIVMEGSADEIMSSDTIKKAYLGK